MTAEVRIQPLSPAGIVFLAAAGLFMLIFQATVLAGYSQAGWAPDLPLIMVVYLGLSAPVVEGAIISVALGFILDAAAGGLFGVRPGLFLAALSTSVLIRRSIDPSAPVYLALFMGAVTLGGGLITGLAHLALRGQFPIWPPRWAEPAAAFLLSVPITAVAGPVVFRILDWLRPGPSGRQESEE